MNKMREPPTNLMMVWVYPETILLPLPRVCVDYIYLDQIPNPKLILNLYPIPPPDPDPPPDPFHDPPPDPFLDPLPYPFPNPFPPPSQRTPH